MAITIDEILSAARADTSSTDASEICHFGDGSRQANRVLVCWMATTEATKHAIEIGADTIICHETLFFPFTMDGQTEPGSMTWRSNTRRAELMEKHGITCARLHAAADELTIFDRFAAMLGLTQPIPESYGFVKAYDVEPTTYGELIERVRSAGLPVLRHTPAEMNRPVKRIGLPWGGLGLFINMCYTEALINLGCDALVAGESDSYGHQYVRESGLVMIETGHEASENPGLSLMVDWLKSRFPELEVSFYETKPAYVIR